jgi:hypothetical protein
VLSPTSCALERPQEALTHFAEALAADADNPAYMVGKARSLLDMGERSQSDAIFDELESAHPGHAARVKR